MDTPAKEDRYAALRIVAAYAVVAALWIYFSDHALEFLGGDPRFLVRISVIKGFAFIVVTGALLYQLITRHLRRTRLISEELLKSRGLVNSLIEGTTDAIYLKDLQGRYLLFNSAAAAITGRDAGSVIGMDDTAVFSAEEAALIMERDRGIMNENRVMTFEERLTAASGEQRTFLVTKGPVRDAAGTVVGLFGISRDITERKRAGEELRALSRRIELILNSTGEGIYGVDLEGRVTFVNAAGARMLGWEPEELTGRSSHATWHHSRSDGTALPAGECRLNDVLRNGVASSVERDVFWRKDGSSFPVEFTSVPIWDKDALSGGVVTFRDITVRLAEEEEKRRLEGQFRQAQKMEAIGHLAGGVAHDFNNILTAIVGYASILRLKLAAEHPSLEYIDQLLASASKAANLTRSLLAFSRKQVINPVPVDINVIVLSMKKILVRVIGEDIGCTVRAAGAPLIVKCDRGQIEHVLMNLATNARDAMPQGGSLSISTEETEIDERFVQAHQYGAPGRYALVTVSDSGTGMEKSTVDRIFEPFFTTKDVGKGTGLGLAMVYGTIKQHGGFINVYSEPGIGTSFKLYLPLASTFGPVEELPSQAGLAMGSETILLVEDDSTVRQVTASLLQMFGYRLIEAEDAEAAVGLFRQHSDTVQLVISDVIMPKLSGKDLYDRLKQINPRVKFLFVSGYTADILLQKGLGNEEIGFLSKPLQPEVLSRKIREILDS
ncbi:MAG: PAS domain S-box protein [Nitrospiraceae bacterium]|nr:PAS domain S-box protein [Nitrospiraceae bacterium]